MRTYYELFQLAQNKLKSCGIADADVDAWYLLTYVFQLQRSFYLIHRNESVKDENKEALFMELLEKRSNHIPLQHLTGSQEFMGLEFNVNEHVLIPRQDTETLVEEVLKVAKGKSVLDMCTGSGCIIISLAKLQELSYGVGVDISKKALEVAQSNQQKHKVTVDFVHSDLFEQVTGTYDIIVSNPPYIPSEVINTLMPEVKEHEPMSALDGMEDGLFFYRKISAALEHYLGKDGYIFYEIGHDQGQDVKNLLEEHGFYDVTIKKDLAGLDRVVYGRRV